MLVDWRDFDSFYLVMDPARKEARDLFELLFDVAPGEQKIEVLTTSMYATQGSNPGLAGPRQALFCY